jgi:hypothetical protein
MKVLLIWDECLGEPKLYEVTGEHVATVVAAHGAYANSSAKNTTLAEKVCDLIYGEDGEGPPPPSFVALDMTKPIENARYDKIVFSGMYQ